MVTQGMVLINNNVFSSNKMIFCKEVFELCLLKFNFANGFLWKLKEG